MNKKKKKRKSSKSRSRSRATKVNDNNRINKNNKSRNEKEVRNEEEEEEEEADESYQFVNEAQESNLNDFDTRSQHSVQSSATIGADTFVSQTLQRAEYKMVVDELVDEKDRHIIEDLVTTLYKHQHVQPLIYNQDSYCSLVSSINSC